MLLPLVADIFLIISVHLGTVPLAGTATAVSRAVMLLLRSLDGDIPTSHGEQYVV